MIKEVSIDILKNQLTTSVKKLGFIEVYNPSIKNYLCPRYYMTAAILSLLELKFVSSFEAKSREKIVNEKQNDLIR